MLADVAHAGASALTGIRRAGHLLGFAATFHPALAPAVLPMRPVLCCTRSSDRIQWPARGWIGYRLCLGVRRCAEPAAAPFGPIDGRRHTNVLLAARSPWN